VSCVDETLGAVHHESLHLNLTMPKTLVDTIVCADDTDHIAFDCSKCSAPMSVKKVETSNIVDKGEAIPCTSIRLVCTNCKSLGVRKFYWKERFRIEPNCLVKSLEEN